MIAEHTDLFLGRLVKPFGIKGELKLHPSDDFWDGVLESHKLRLVAAVEAEHSEGMPELERFRRHGSSYLLKFTGVDDRDGAQALVGAELFIPLAEMDIDLPDTILPFQIIGCNVRTEDGEHIGRVTGVMFTPAHQIYEVTSENGVNLIPAVPEFIIEMNLDAGEVVVRPIPGLLNGT